VALVCAGGALLAGNLSAAASSSASVATNAPSGPIWTDTPAPTDTPVPTDTAMPTLVPTPTCIPDAVGCNPWGYNFDRGSYITSPPADFCAYFNCIASFWNGRGYVVECSDQTYSDSGGIQGSCSHHGGDWRPLLAP
jgi:hypothetical protein